MVSSPHNFPCTLYFVHRNEENPIFQLRECKTCLLSNLNKCRIMFAVIYYDMGSWGHAFTQMYMFEQKNENFQNFT